MIKYFLISLCVLAFSIIISIGLSIYVCLKDAFWEYSILEKKGDDFIIGFKKSCKEAYVDFKNLIKGVILGKLLPIYIIFIFLGICIYSLKSVISFILNF